MKSILWLIVYILIALTLVSGVIIDAQYGPFRWMPSMVWLCYLGYSAVLFYLLIKQLKWRHLIKAYKILLLLFIIHTIIYVYIYLHATSDLPQILYMLLSLMEYYIYGYILIRYMVWKNIYHEHRP